ncbi:unnamed protein product [Gongylonema pulchrum]|uniref:Protein kinase domain-containing protein n=1 Tax=Gongylonema pulchrum TaxID=637853 RepID=A0A183D5Y3_9BILA|nr:unnamed protein product [Gongylonema pulchrum]
MLVLLFSSPPSEMIAPDINITSKNFGIDFITDSANFQYSAIFLEECTEDQFDTDVYFGLVLIWNMSHLMPNHVANEKTWSIRPFRKK